MDTELLSALCLEDLECLKDLLGRHSVLGIARVVHDVVADLEHSTRIVTTADRLRDISNCLLYALDMGDIVEVDDGSEIICQLKLLESGYRWKKT